MQPYIAGQFWVNKPGRVFVARRGRSELTTTILGAGELADLVERMLRTSGRRIDMSTPFVDAMMPDGSRLHVVIPDMIEGDASDRPKRCSLPSSPAWIRVGGRWLLSASCGRLADFLRTRCGPRSCDVRFVDRRSGNENSAAIASRPSVRCTCSRSMARFPGGSPLGRGRAGSVQVA